MTLSLLGARRSLGLSVSTRRIRCRKGRSGRNEDGKDSSGTWAGRRDVGALIVGKRLEAALLAEGAPDASSIDPRVRELGDRPCGGDALARGGRIPAEGDGYLVPDVVQELGADHRVIRRWLIPIEFWPIGLEGDRLLLTSGRGEPPARYWIGLDRRIQRDDQAADDDPQSEACPAEAEAKLPESAYRICVVLKDRKTGTAHRLAFDGVCT